MSALLYFISSLPQSYISQLTASFHRCGNGFKGRTCLPKVRPLLANRRGARFGARLLPWGWQRTLGVPGTECGSAKGLGPSCHPRDVPVEMMACKQQKPALVVLGRISVY